MSALSYDSKIVKEFGITDKHELEGEQKILYARSQLEEIKKFLWRERVELQLAEAQSHSDIEALAAKAHQNVAEKRNNIKGIVASIDVLNELVSELESEYSE